MKEHTFSASYELPELVCRVGRGWKNQIKDNPILELAMRSSARQDPNAPLVRSAKSPAKIQSSKRLIPLTINQSQHIGHHPPISPMRLTQGLSVRVHTLLLPVLYPFAASTATIISLGDGDTLRVADRGKNLTIRVACIDAPETAQAPYGQQARQALQALLPIGCTVTLKV